MTFAEALESSGLSGKQFSALVERLTGHHLRESTISRWKTRPEANMGSAQALAIVALIALSKVGELK